MIYNRYNKIIMPFFFIADCIIVIIIYLVNEYINNADASYYNILITFLLWIIPSLIHKSYKVPRVNSTFQGIMPHIKTIFTFSILIMILSYFQFISTFNTKVNLIFLSETFLLIIIFSIIKFKFFYK